MSTLTKNTPGTGWGNRLRSSPAGRLLAQVEQAQVKASRSLNMQRKVAYGQFFTPLPVANRMAAMLGHTEGSPRILDAGAGVGVLFTARVAQLCEQGQRPSAIHVTAYEIDPYLADFARASLQFCRQTCLDVGITFVGEVVEADFLEHGLTLVGYDLFAPQSSQFFTDAIVNPPYRKIQASSRERKLLRQVGIEATNLYVGFLELAMRLLAPGGSFVSITPRSFCNGAYFKGFRRSFLTTMSLRELHLFESRQAVFGDQTVGQQVLQESLIVSARKRNEGPLESLPVRVALSEDAGDTALLVRDVPYQHIVRPDDPLSVIHISPDELGGASTQTLAMLPCTLDTLGLHVSTGRVVDFRVREHLKWDPEPGDAPLIYPTHLTDGHINWPILHGKKPNALGYGPQTRALIIPNETYVLVKRFSSKEERRRIVATVYEGKRLPGESIGFENHLNYFHAHSRGISLALSRGLAAFLNSTLVDTAFRQFSGHTQVNATDLRSLRYPTKEQLERLGDLIGDKHPSQSKLDELIRGERIAMAEGAAVDTVKAKQRIEEAITVLRALEFPRTQQNERSALTLLALLDVAPATPWTEASAPLRGVTPLMEFFTRHYGKTYAPNSRETVRRQTLHQFLDAALVRINPDIPGRPVNSGQTVYQIEANALALLRMFGSPDWQAALERYLSTVTTLKERYAQERFMARIPLRLAEGKTITLSPGGQNILIERIIHDFAERFIPDGSLVYIGDAERKFAYFDEQLLTSLGVQIEAHGKMPDVIIHDDKRSVLALIEAVTSHGPVNAQRKAELERLFEGCSADIIFLTAFLTRQAMTKYIGEIAWETEVWLADSPDHLIHFDGDQLPAPPARRA